MVAVTDTAVTVALSAAGAAMANCWQSLRLSRPRLAAVAMTAMAAILILLRRCSAANKENSLSSVPQQTWEAARLPMWAIAGQGAPAAAAAPAAA